MSEWQLAEFGKVPASWRYEPLENFLALITYGFTNPMPTTADGPYMLTAKDIFGGKIQYKGARKTSWDSYENRITDKSRPKISDVLITKDGSIGRVAIVDKNDICVSQSVAVMRTNSQLDPMFLKYLLESDQYQQLIDIDATGSTIQHIYITKINKMLIAVPDGSEQKSIVSVLSSLDDKIDLLHRQNKTLEAMAETLFRQWFVEEAGDWEEVALQDVTARITDGSHTSPATVEAGKPMASVKDMYQWGIDTSTCRHIADDDYEELVRTDCRPLKNDILIAKDGSFLKHVFVAEDDLDVVILSSIAILRPNGKYHPLLLATFLKMKSTIEAMENIVTGGVIPRIVLKDFRKFKLLLPPEELQKEALRQIKPIYEKCWENNRQIKTLEKLRDGLLPKLMSGEVRVA